MIIYDNDNHDRWHDKEYEYGIGIVWEMSAGRRRIVTMHLVGASRDTFVVIISLFHINIIVSLQAHVGFILSSMS